PTTPRRSSQPWLIAAGTAALLLVLIVAFSTSGGDGDDSNNETSQTAGAEGTDNGGSAPDDDGVISDESRNPDPEENTHHFSGGQTAEYTSGLAITLSPLDVVPSDKLPYSLDPGEEGYWFTVTLENKGEEPIDAAFSPDVFAGENGVEASSLSGIEYDTSLYGTVMPGRSLTTEFAYHVPVDSGFIEVQYERYAVTIWTLELP
ncbi:hypothetical protein, partial [Streptomyces sp. 6N223]|uniref:hypothetical protein n=1 Tax=Streptomyces sp. 6N223 TaxID=3457412 RepID=UPI003FD59AF5